MPTTTTAGHTLKLIVTATLIHGGKVLFVKYKDPVDGQEGWILPTAIVEEISDPLDFCRELIKREVDISVSSLDVSHVESFVGRDGTWHLAIHYFTQLQDKTEPKASNHISSVEWLIVNAFPDNEVFAYHGWCRDVASTASAKLR